MVLVPVLAHADVLKELESKCGEAHGGLFKRLVIKNLPRLELVVVSDFESPNVALNPNSRYDVVDVDESRRTAYLQTPDGSRGIKVVFQKGDYNRLKMFDRVVLDLNGCKVGKVGETDAMYVTDLTPLNVVKVTKGTEADAPAKEMYMSELTDKDIFTRVTLKDAEFAFREGAMVNFGEFYGQYIPEIHSSYKTKMISNCDGTCCVLRDSQGGSIYMALNTLCPWIREKAPQGSGKVTGVLVVERNRRYGDRYAKYYIRPMFREDIAIDLKKKTAAWDHHVAWIPERIDGNNFDFEKAGFGPEGIEDRLLNNVGPVSYLSYDAGNGKIRKAMSFNNLLNRTGSAEVAGGSIKTYSALNQWYVWGPDGNVESTRSIIVEFSTAKFKDELMQFGFDIMGADGNLLNCRGVPLRWKVECSVDGGDWIPVKEADGTETFGMRPMPAEAKFDGRYNHTYQMMYDHGFGLQQHIYNLPAEAVGKDKVVMRITPAEDRFFHLSKNPAKDVEIPVVHDKIKPNNKTFTTFRIGMVFVDYK